MMKKPLVLWNAYKQNASIFGLAQSGKTNLGIFLALNLYQVGYNVIIRDPHRLFTILNPMFVKHDISELQGKGIEILQEPLLTKKSLKELSKKLLTMSHVVAIFDELHNDLTKYRSPEEFDLFCRNCNNMNMGFIAIFQRPQEVTTMVSSNSHHVFAFPLEYPSDIQLMSKWIGEEYEEFAKNHEPFTFAYHQIGKRGVTISKVEKMVS